MRSSMAVFQRQVAQSPFDDRPESGAFHRLAGWASPTVLECGAGHLEDGAAAPPARPTCDRTSPVGIAARLQRTPDLSQRESALAEEEDHTDVPDCPPDITPSSRRPSRRAAPILHLRRERLDPRTDPFHLLRSHTATRSQPDGSPSGPGTVPDGATGVSLHDADARPMAKGRLGRPIQVRLQGPGPRQRRRNRARPHRRARQSGRGPLAPAVARVIARTGCRPRTVTADRGYGEARVESDLHRAGVPTWPPCRCGRCI